MFDVSAWNAVIAYFTPTIISYLLIKKSWPEEVKYAIIGAVSLAIAFGDTYFSGKFDPSHLGTTLLIVAGAAWIGYQARIRLYAEGKGPVKDKPADPAPETPAGE